MRIGFFALVLFFALYPITPSLSVAAAAAPDAEIKPDPIAIKRNPVDGGDTAWMLVSTGLVMLMVPGLALFYAGMVRRKNVLGTMMHSMIALAIVGVQWVVVGYSIAFGTSQGGWFGWNWDYVCLRGVDPAQTFPGTKIPLYVHCMFQGMFAIITPALISGALAERIRFAPYCIFILLWTTLIYDPLAHWVWAVAPKTAADETITESVGWLGRMGALDFAGGTVVHIAAGFSALAAILLLPKRRGYPEHAMSPNGMVLTLTGAGLLWFGWFGFNGGSAGASSAHAALAFTATQCAAAAAGLMWAIVEWVHRGKPTALGLASGIVAGLVAITPASGYVGPAAALLIGLISGLVCYVAVYAKSIFKYDDSLDAFGVHGVGGFLGAVLTGVFASFALWVSATGTTVDAETALGVIKKPWPGDMGSQVSVQIVAALAAAIYGFVGTAVLVFAIKSVTPFALDEEGENLGTDRAEHGEVGFDFGLAGSLDGETRRTEPRAASKPPEANKRFTVVVEGVDEKELVEAWSKLCQTGIVHPEEFKKLYPLLTTIKGNRFHFRSGDHFNVRDNLKRLFENVLNTTVTTYVED
jgi:ammonium transporter